MPQSKAHKYFNKFSSWARYEGSIQAEIPAAQEEFFITPRAPLEDKLVMGLFIDWFLFDRKLTYCNLTPLELFIKTRGKKLKENELIIYEAFLTSNRFGFFRVEKFEVGEWMELKVMPDGDIFRVFDEAGSEQVVIGSVLIARLCAFEGHWAMSGFVTKMPDEGRYMLEQQFSKAGHLLKDDPVRPRHILSFLMPEIDWESEGLAVVKAKVASILERWKTEGVKVSQIERAIESAHAQKQGPPAIFEQLLKKAPSQLEMQQTMKVLTAFWNLKIPSADKNALRKGPLEKMLMGNLISTVEQSLSKEDYVNPAKVREATAAKTRAWLDAPLAEFDGKTPRSIILEERKSLGNPQEGIGYEIRPSVIEMDSQEEQAEALEWARQAQAFLLEGKAEKAIEYYNKAYPHLKDYPDLFRILGNLAGAYIRLGNREKSLEILRAALKSNPDYVIARNNLHLLESMSSEEFERRYKAGFFEKVAVINDKTE